MAFNLSNARHQPERVELGELRQPDLVVSRVAAAVGVSEEPGRPLAETLAEALRARRLLLALDTCEHLIGACAGLSQDLLAASPGLRLPGQARYRMPDTIREYAAARLADSGDSAKFQRALRDYVLRIAEDSLAVGMAQVPVPWPERVECSLRYDADSANVAQVLAWCLEHGDVESGLRICAAVSPRWTVWGTSAEGGEWLDSFLAQDVSAVSLQVRGAALVARTQRFVQ